MSYVFKSINPSDIYITNFDVFKQYSTTDDNDIVFQGSYLTFPQQIDSDSPPTSSTSGLYKFVTHNSIYNGFYEDYYSSPLNKIGYTSPKERRELHEDVIIFSVSQSKFGYNIKKKSVELSIDSDTIIDDGEGNLIDTTDRNTVYKLRNFIETKLVSELDFNHGYRHASTLVESSSYTNNYNDQILYNNIKFIDGHYGKQALFTSTSSYAAIKSKKKFNFKRTHNYAISGFITTPISQSELTNDTNLILHKATGSSAYPYQIEVFNSNTADKGKIKFSQSDSKNITIVTSSIATNDNTRRHYVFKKSGSELQMIIDGSLDNVVTANVKGDTHNDYDLYLGKDFTGSLDEVKIISGTLSNTDAENLSTYEDDSSYNYYVGNVFYESGLVTLTHPKYSGSADTMSSYTLAHKSTKTIEEYEILCTVHGNELSQTTNPSAYNVDTMKYESFVTHSNFSPYITSIGLYNDDNELLGVAKVSKPIKKPNYDLTLIIKFDID